VLCRISALKSFVCPSFIKLRNMRFITEYYVPLSALKWRTDTLKAHFWDKL